MIFVVVCSKVLNLFLVPNYNIQFNKAYLSIFTSKLKNYPLYFDKQYGVKSNKMAMKFLHSDLVKVMKTLNINVPEELGSFNNFADLQRLLEIFNKTYLN